MLFECDSLLRKNIYSVLTPFSEFILKNKFGNSIFNTNEQKNSEIVKFSIFTQQIVKKDRDFTQGKTDLVKLSVYYTTLEIFSCQLTHLISAKHRH